MANIRWFKDIDMNDVDQVGGKNASLGEMVQNLAKANVKVPNGFATTADAFRKFLSQDGLDQKIYARLKETDIENINQLQAAGKDIRDWVKQAPMPADLEKDIREAYQVLERELGSDFSVAVRSSATAEDLPDASFAGQQETFLNVNGIDDVLLTMKEVFASLFNDRAIAYREHQNFEHENVALSAGVQQMVRSDMATSGVMFSVDTESGFDQVVFITASYGLGETVVQGAVNPDEFYVFKPSLQQGKQAVIRRSVGSKHIRMIYDDVERVKTIDVPEEEQTKFCISNEDAMQLARYAVDIEKHYARPMDVEWAKDGKSGELYIVQARPETVISQAGQTIERFELEEEGSILCEGRAIGQKIGIGVARVIKSAAQMNEVQAGDVLVTDMTDPDWEPVMKKAAAIVTNRGGRTCHAAIIARELGIPAVVGCGDASKVIKDGQVVTVSCAQGDTGYIYADKLNYQQQHVDVEKMPDIPVKIMLNVGNPDRAFDFQKLPNAGVGLARLEFIINRMVGIHPQALLDFDKCNAKLQAEISKRIQGYDNPKQFFIDKVAEGVATIAAAFYPKPVIVRMSDFKSNEYAHLIGGQQFEPEEENPMIGFRGASRYTANSFAQCFALECAAMRKVRLDMGLDNVQIMVPFVRTLDEAKEVIDVLAYNGIERGKDGLKLIMMCEIPSNAILADKFLQYFDGFSIGSNDLTQLTLGLDRDSSLVAHRFDERDPAVKALVANAIQTCNKMGKYIGICGQGPSDYPDFAQWLLKQKISSISLNPDTVISTWLRLAETELA
jgi:pyruvate,water dikinase